MTVKRASLMRSGCAPVKRKAVAELAYRWYNQINCEQCNKCTANTEQTQEAFMAATERVLGKLEDGTEIRRITLTNAKGTQASFTDLGAIWLTMVVKDKDGQAKDVVLGADEIPVLLQNPGHMGEPVGRNANRIGNAEFRLNGKTITLGKNNGVNNLHSGPDYWRTRIWEAEYGDSGLGAYVMFSLSSADGDQGFPGNAEVCVKYILSDDDALTIEYQAQCDQDTIFNMTNHAYFNMAGHDSGTILDQIVWIDADRYTPTDEGSIPTGELAKVSGTPMDFTTPKPIGQDIDAKFPALAVGSGYDHNWALNHEEDGLRVVATQYAPSSGIKMTVMTDLEGIQFYTANKMAAGTRGKGGVSYGPRCGCCFETQHYPDSVNKPDWKDGFTKAGEDYKTTTVYRFEVV